jgi:hypothetical protein
MSSASRSLVFNRGSNRLQLSSAFDLDALANHAQAFLDTRARPTADIAPDPGGVSPQTRITG